MKIYISESIGAERLPFAQPGMVPYGRAHYSWKIIADMYRRAIGMLRIDVETIKAPDIYQSANARTIQGISDSDIHFAIKPAEYVRPMFGVRNFFVCGWEFPEFSQEDINSDPTRNQISLFKRAESTVCWSEFTANNLRKHGVDRSVSLPPPVFDLFSLDANSVDEITCLHYSPDEEDEFNYTNLKSVRDRFEVIFLTVLNPWDKRKNLRNLIDSFTEFRNKTDANCALVVKLIVDNIGTRAENFVSILKNNYGVSEFSENIYFFGDHLDQKSMAGLYKYFDYYFCASSAEGLNLPLIESMAAGLVPISSQATAMADYIRPSNAIVLPARAKRAGADISALGESMQLTHFPPTKAALVKSLEEALSLPGKSRSQKAENAQATIRARYGLARFAEDFAKLIGA